MKKCVKCGKILLDNEVCDCLKNSKPNFLIDDVMSSPESTNIYERSKRIVPDCIASNDGEIPIKQYNIAILQSRVKRMRAEGRMQITNNRVLFRATGRSLTGRTILQHEFAINEIAGIEARRDYRFSMADIFLGLLIGFICAGVMNALFNVLYSFNDSSIITVLALMAGISSILLSISVKNKAVKLILSAVGNGPILLIAAKALTNFIYGNKFTDKIGFIIFILIYVCSFILYIINLVLFGFRPNLIISIITKSGNGVIQIRRERSGGLFGLFINSSNAEFTGYHEVLPTAETDSAICEMGAMINDIQKLGDLGVGKWKK